MKLRDDLTAEYVRSMFSYDPATGIFSRRFSIGGKPVGAVAGTRVTGGYVSIIIKKVHYKAHRLAWLYVHGAWPSEFIDHIDHDPSNNRIDNLREATASQNQFNRGALNKTGYKGVARAGPGYAAYINVRGEHRYLGYFSTAEAAGLAYRAAAKASHGEFFFERTNRVPEAQDAGKAIG